ncbi:MAG: shikimate kinase [Thermomicrobiales bacterium]
MTTPAAAVRKRILITGMSGTGKSSVVLKLIERGYVAVDADAPGYSAEVPAPEDELTGIGPGRDWVWQEEAIRALLDRPDPVIFLAGCSPNQGAFYPALTHVILLTASPAVITERLATRANNPFGKDPGELARTLALQAEIEPLLRRSATHVIDTCASLDDVVMEVLRSSTRLPSPARYGS